MPKSLKILLEWATKRRAQGFTPPDWRCYTGREKQSSCPLWVTLLWLHTPAYHTQRCQQQQQQVKTAVFWSPSTSQHSLTWNTNMVFVAVNLRQVHRFLHELFKRTKPFRLKPGTKLNSAHLSCQLVVWTNIKAFFVTCSMTPTLVVMQQV